MDVSRLGPTSISAEKRRAWIILESGGLDAGQGEAINAGQRASE
jgi:hypothetical protein